MKTDLKSRYLIYVFLFALAIIFSACLGRGEVTVSYDDQIEQVVAATLTKEAFMESIDAVRKTEESKEPSSEVEFDSTAEEIPTPTSTPTPEPDHDMIPESPTRRVMWISDLITVDLAKDKTALGDNYAWNRLERPYTAEGMEYRDYLDIYEADLQVTDPWVYVTIILIGDLPAEGDIRYMVELDTDHDGRGDFLVMAILPPDATWITDGVKVLSDADEDVGGVFALYKEDPGPLLTGYELELFADGVGEDRDLAWVRRDPTSKSQIQLAFKKSIIGEVGFLWSVWADEGLRDPALFDYNDNFTFYDAGSPNKENFRYPVKAVALVDSTCRMWYGYVPGGLEPGLCFSGEMAVKRPGFGWCIPAADNMGCSGSCTSKCPKDRVCVPCER